MGRVLMWAVRSGARPEQVKPHRPVAPSRDVRGPSLRLLAAAWTEDVAQPIRRARNPLKPRVAQPVVIVEVDGAIAVCVLEQQAERRVGSLGGRDDVA